MADLVKRNPGKIVAARIHAYAPERMAPFGKPELRELWKKAADLGLMVQLHFEPRWAPGFEPLIQEFTGHDGDHRPLGPADPGDPRGARARGRMVEVPEHGHQAERASAPDAVPPPRRRALRPESGRRLRTGPDDLRGRLRARRDGRLVPGGAGAAARVRLPSPADDQDKIAGGTAAKLFKFGGVDYSGR
jgi:hypothetical protein